MMFIRKTGLFVLIMVMKALSILGQEEMHYHNITADQGLSQSFVNCIYQDRQGFMWFGTQDGLNRYDGNSITIFKNNPVDSNSLPSNNINCLYEDGQGILWIGTDAGLSAYNTYTGKFINYVHGSAAGSLSSNNIHAIFADKEGNIWIGLAYDLINRFNREKNQFIQYELNPGDTNENHYISSVTEDNSGLLWAGSFGNGLYSLDKKTGAVKNYLQVKPNKSPLYPFIGKINSILFRKESNEIYAATNGDGLEIFDISKKNFTHVFINRDARDKFPGSINGMAEDAPGDIWLAVANGEGVIKYDADEGRFSSFKGVSGSSQSVNDNTCNSAFIGSDGILWVGTNNGVAYYIPQKRSFVNYNDTVNASSNVVMSIARDAEGKLWIGTNGGGLYSVKENEKKYEYNNELNNAMGNKSALSLYTDKKGILWIGTWGSGILGYNPLTEKYIYTDSLNSTLAQSTVTNITQDHRDKIWIGTYGDGVFLYDEKNKTLEHLNAQLSNNSIYCFYEDKDRNMWIGTDGGGINVYNTDNGKNTVIEKNSGKNTLSSNSVNCFYEDAKGNMWIGTAAGLNKYTPSTHKFVNYFEKDGLPNNYVYTILADNEGYLWLSTNKGLSRFNPNDPNEDGRAFKNYDKTDGLTTNEFNQGACFKAPDGRLFFGSINGLVGFHPEKVFGNLHVPPVYITSCELFGKELITDTLISAKKHLEFLWKNNTLSFSFAGLDFQLPSKNKYSYMLEGLDKDWSLPSTEHFASYAQLPPGNYILRVRACNNDGVWNNTGASIYIRIIPPFWKTTWFYILCIVLAIGSVIGYTQYRTFLIKKEKRILESKVEERTHELAERTRELAEKNHDITSSIEYAKRIQQAILPPVDEIKKHLPQSFILYRPKDIVSGDFYWFGEKNGKAIIAVADCTGHGVPGALMSMIGHNLLNQIIMEQGITKPDLILNNLNSLVQKVLKQGISNIDTTDGMDIAICSIEKASGELQFAGAYRPLLVISDGTYTKVEPDKKPIGGSQMGMERTFKNNDVKLKKGSAIYMFSDGYADQFGGPEMKKYMLKRFIDKLLNISNLPMEEQEKQLLANLEAWQGNHEQVDDVLVIGIHFS